jgi:hypothetical protein
MINFVTIDLESTDTPCIFKVNDHVLNHQLSLQVIELMHDVFQVGAVPAALQSHQHYDSRRILGASLRASQD